MGPVPFSLSAEVSLLSNFRPQKRLTSSDKVFPLENRVVGMSFSVFLNLLGAGILTLVVPPLTVSLLSKCDQGAQDHQNPCYAAISYPVPLP
jgi:hypothetical protein